jgi:hypothetical protein
MILLCLLLGDAHAEKHDVNPPEERTCRTPCGGGLQMKRFLVLLVLAAVTLAYANDAKLSPDLRKVSTAKATVVIQYNNPPSLLDLQIPF